MLLFDILKTFPLHWTPHHIWLCPAPDFSLHREPVGRAENQIYDIKISLFNPPGIVEC